MIELVEVKRTYPKLLADMDVHYSQPKWFVGRNICYAVMVDGVYYGGIVGGSATKHLPGRADFFSSIEVPFSLNTVVNNIFFHVEKKDGNYPERNFVPKVLATFRSAVVPRWKEKYGDDVVGFERLIELPRTGECYRRDGWTLVGQTKGYTCKRTGGQGTDSWSGKRVWDVVNLRPKIVMCRPVDATAVPSRVSLDDTQQAA